MKKINKNMIIYRILFPNNKCYIGLTTRTLNKRKKEHFYDSIVKKTKLYRAIRKYGYYNLKWEIINKTAINWKHLNKLEKKYIKEYNSYHKGYNSSLGGEEGNFYDLPEKKIVKLYIEKNDSIVKIGKKIKVHNSTILNLLTKLNVKIKNRGWGRRKEFTLNEIKNICDLYINKKISLKNIGKIYGTREKPIKRILNNNDVVLKKAKKINKFTKIEEDKICVLYTNFKYGMKKIGNILGYNKAVIERVLKNNNIETRKKPTKIYFTKKQIEKMIYLYKMEFKSCKKISHIFNTSEQTIKRNLLKNGIKIRSYLAGKVA